MFTEGGWVEIGRGGVWKSSEMGYEEGGDREGVQVKNGRAVMKGLVENWDSLVKFTCTNYPRCQG